MFKMGWRNRGEEVPRRKSSGSKPKGFSLDAIHREEKGATSKNHAVERARAHMRLQYPILGELPDAEFQAKLGGKYFVEFSQLLEYYKSNDGLDVIKFVASL